MTQFDKIFEDQKGNGSETESLAPNPPGKASVNFIALGVTKLLPPLLVKWPGADNTGLLAF